MNGIIAKIILSFTGLVFFVVLIFSTLPSNEQSLTVLPNFGKENIGEYMYTQTGSGKLIKKKINFIQTSTGITKGLYEKNLDIFTCVYSDNINYSTSIKGQTTHIEIQVGKYLIDSKNSFNKVIIKAGQYSISLEKGGMIYIDNSNKKSFIISLNNTAKINFVHNDPELQGVEIYLYPHMYLGFKVNRLSTKNELDSLRLSQLANLGFFPENFENIDKGLMFEILKETKFIVKALDIVNTKHKEQLNILHTKISNDILKISGIEYIKKYFLFFYNDKKKLVYFQNKVLKNLVKLLTRSDNVLEIIAKTFEDLEEINKIDSIEYNNMVYLIENFYSLAFNDLESDIGSNNYSLFLHKIYSINRKKKINIMKDFNRLNFEGKTTYYNKLLAIYDSSKGNFQKEDYYLYFIRNIIFEGFNDEKLSKENFNTLIDILNAYSQSLLSGNTREGDSDTKKITNIVYNEKILTVIQKALKKRYFGKRTVAGLLPRTQEKIRNLKGLNQAIENIQDYYSVGKILLDVNTSKYSEIIKNYKNTNTQFEEYFFAFENYALYQKKYSDTGKAIDGVTVFSDGEELGLNKNKFIEYIRQFGGIDLNSISLSIKKSEYIIDNISIEGQNFSFILNPYRGNRMMEIIAKDIDFDKNTKEDIFYKKLQNITYELDYEQDKYEKLLEKTKDEDRERLDFKNFFKNNLFPSDSLVRKSCEDDVKCGGRDTDIEVEDEIIQLFKTATLLGSKGEFRNIKKFIGLKYSKIFVTKEKDTDFQITIKNTKLSINVLKDKRIKLVSADFNGDYKLEGGHYFSNITIKPYERSSQGDFDYIFGKVPLHINGKIGIAQFESKMKSIFEQLDYISKKYIEFQEKNHGKVSQINFFIKSGEVTFE